MTAYTPVKTFSQLIGCSALQHIHWHQIQMHAGPGGLYMWLQSWWLTLFQISVGSEKRHVLHNNMAAVWAA